MFVVRYFRSIMCFSMMLKTIAIECCPNGTHIINRSGDLWSPIVHPACKNQAMITEGIHVEEHSELGLFLAVLISMVLGIVVGLRCYKLRRMLRK